MPPNFSMLIEDNRSKLIKGVKRYNSYSKEMFKLSTESNWLSYMLPAVLVLVILAMPVCAQGSPQITIIEPKNGTTIPAGDVTVSVNVANFNIVDKQGQAKAAGEGHIHYFMDVAAPTNPNKPAVTAPGTYVHILDKSYTWKNVIPGNHNFSVELVNNDHTPLTPPAVAMVDVTAAGTATGSQMISGGTPSGNKSIVIGLAARQMQFNATTITVPAGSNVTIDFDNQDSGVNHNFALYDNQDATNYIYIGKIITGPAKATYVFTAPTKPGTYFFRCDVHPRTMTGNFIVT